MYRIFTFYDGPFQSTFTGAGLYHALILDYNSLAAETRDFKFELYPLHSPLLGVSLLVSFPLLNNMLKFSR